MSMMAQTGVGYLALSRSELGRGAAADVRGRGGDGRNDARRGVRPLPPEATS